MSESVIITSQEAREMLTRKGLSIAAFARLNGLNYRLVRGVLDGRYTCRFGKSHKAAVLLGLKVGSVACTDQPQ